MQGKAGKTKRQSRQENSLLRSRYPAQYGSRPKCLPLAVDTVPKIVRAVLLSCRAEVATGKPRRKRSGACLIADITRQPLGSLKLTYPDKHAFCSGFVHHLRYSHEERTLVRARLR